MSTSIVSRFTTGKSAGITNKRCDLISFQLLSDQRYHSNGANDLPRHKVMTSCSLINILWVSLGAIDKYWKCQMKQIDLSHTSSVFNLWVWSHHLVSDTKSFIPNEYNPLHKLHEMTLLSVVSCGSKFIHGVDILEITSFAFSSNSMNSTKINFLYFKKSRT